MICIYVALQIGATHTVNKPQTDNLASAFATLDQAIKEAGGEVFDVFPDELAKLRKIQNQKAAQNITDTQTASEPGQAAQIQTASEPEQTARQEFTDAQKALGRNGHVLLFEVLTRWSL